MRGTLCHTPPHHHVTHEGVTHVLLDPRVEMLPGRRVHQVSHSRSLRAASVTHSGAFANAVTHSGAFANAHLVQMSVQAVSQ